MIANERLLDLLTDWEEDYRRGNDRTAEDLCPDDAELQAELRNRIEKRRRFHELLDTTAAPRGGADAAPALPAVDGYQILQVLGSGGMGVVYKARHVALNRVVALKMVLSGQAATEPERQRFRAEAEASARLQHPHIVQIHEIGQQDGRPFITLEFVSGGSLSQLMGGQPLPPRRAAEILRQVAQGVQHAHEQGIIHRDLKPSNVLVTQQGLPKIADFGLAKRLDEDQRLTQPGAILGSPCYMAPEQAAGATTEIGPATDIYALGVILYEMLTGRPPFQGASVVETLEQVRNRDPVPPRTLQPRVAADLETVCLKCLEKRPQDRYASAAALVQDLDRFLAGEPTSARPMTTLQSVMRLLQRNTFDPRFTQYGFVMLVASPLPLLVGLFVFFTFRGSASFERIIGWTTIALFLAIQVFFDVANRPVLRAVPASQRRHMTTMWRVHWLGMVLIWCLLQITLPAESPELLLIAFPLWITQAGFANFSFAFEVGHFYVVGVLFWLVALTAAVFLPIAPLIATGLASTNLLTQGIVFSALARQLKKGKPA